jgi:hypothetical protein
MTSLQLVLLLAALQIADAASTLYFLKHTQLHEANPVLRWAFERFGPATSLLVSKGIFMAAIWYYHDVTPLWMLWSVAVFYVGVVGWNVYNIRQYRERMNGN